MAPLMFLSAFLMGANAMTEEDQEFNNAMYVDQVVQQQWVDLQNRTKEFVEQKKKDLHTASLSLVLQIRKAKGMGPSGPVDGDTIFEDLDAENKAIDYVHDVSKSDEEKISIFKERLESWQPDHEIKQENFPTDADCLDQFKELREANLAYKKASDISGLYQMQAKQVEEELNTVRWQRSEKCNASPAPIANGCQSSPDVCSYKGGDPARQGTVCRADDTSCHCLANVHYFTSGYYLSTDGEMCKDDVHELKSADDSACRRALKELRPEWDEKDIVLDASEEKGCDVQYANQRHSVCRDLTQFCDEGVAAEEAAINDRELDDLHYDTFLKENSCIKALGLFTCDAELNTTDAFLSTDKVLSMKKPNQYSVRTEKNAVDLCNYVAYMHEFLEIIFHAEWEDLEKEILKYEAEFNPIALLEEDL